MPVGNIETMGSRTLLFLLLGLALAQDAVSGGWGLDALMPTLAQNSGGRASFNEKKFIALLDKPVESSGELVYVRPDHLEKNTLRPRPEYLTLDRGTLSIERRGQKQSLQLNDYSELAAFIESIRGTLAGDRNALERVYRLYLGGSSAHWTLLLLPSSPEMAATISQIKVTGEGAQLRSIEIQQADGDRSVMTIEQIRVVP
jgi:hypothetical protein